MSANKGSKGDGTGLDGDGSGRGFNQEGVAGGELLEESSFNNGAIVVDGLDVLALTELDRGGVHDAFGAASVCSRVGVQDESILCTSHLVSLAFLGLGTFVEG